MENIDIRICPRCGSDACFTNGYEFNVCYGCGFVTSDVTEDDPIPELFKELKFTDDKGLNWYPSTIMGANKEMVFPDGKSKDEWKWAAVQSKEGKPDMSTLKHFDEKDYMEALDYISYFNK